MLEINGCIVTIDAMGTQTEIAKKITEKGRIISSPSRKTRKHFTKMCGCFSGNIRQIRQDFPLFAVLRVIVRDMAAMRAEPVISVRILGGWRAVRNGMICL